MSSGRFVGRSELGKRSSSVLRDLHDSGETCYITEDGKAKAVLMDINRYNAIMDVVVETESAKPAIPEEMRQRVSVRNILRETVAIRKRPSDQPSKK